MMYWMACRSQPLESLARQKKTPPELLALKLLNKFIKCIPT